MDLTAIPPRPGTPQVLLHRLPDRDDEEPPQKPSKYVILIMGSTAVVGKVAIARSVSDALSCTLREGDSIHRSSAKAASVSTSGEPNKERYQRMWLSKMTRTGDLFPEESRPATEGFSGFGGTASSTSTSRRGSVSSVASGHSSSSSAASPYIASSQPPARPITSTFQTEASVPRGLAVFTLSEKERQRRANPALMVLTHPELEAWHRLAIRNAVGPYGIGVVFVPLYEEVEEEEGEEEEVLRPLDPSKMGSFPAWVGDDHMREGAGKKRGWGSLDREMKVRIDVDADVEAKTAEIIELVRGVMGVDG
ncbi:hypothetical protein QBC34DRAFT_441210 [Podospora aff. communis PSN243]|uniref:Uncharacterized protein n=1 Tax=Podospora aff. communis PSN243 TaxID=3040156 RepID=A0AAV9GF76_9PEZI|nr:hypothetical protein QBC34DRAFT_441210 [Podospora aff. communis PSN243]